MNFSADIGMQKNMSYSTARPTFEVVVTRNAIVLMLCISINYINGTLVHTFFRHKMFRENPRYILFIHLVFNDMIQLTIAALLNLITYIWFKINVSFCCFLLMIAISTTQNTPLNLAGMAIERYIAVCNPLRHAQLCTVNRTYILIAIIWALGVAAILPDLFVLLVTEPNEFFHSAIFCHRDPLFRQDFMKKKKTISYITYLSFVWFILVFTYFKILFAAKAVNADAKKARNTILLHGAQLLMCMFTYVGPPLETVFKYTFPAHFPQLRFASYLMIHILPRFLSPILYGLRDQSFRKYFKMYLLCNVKDSGGQTMNISADIGTQKNMSYSTARPTLEVVVTRNAIVLMLCISINYINGTLVHTFFRREIFRENPRYILFIHLVLNDMIQLTITALLHLIAYVWFKINVSFCCFLLMITVSTTLNTPLNLAGMAVERYIAVCNPLRHAQLCTVNRTYILITIIWALGAAAILPDLFVLLVTESNEFFHSVIYCNRDSLFHQAFMKKKKNISHITYLSCVWLILVFTYFKILFAAKAVNEDAKKARNTILLHGAQLLMCMFTYDSGAQTRNFSADIGMQKNMSYSTARPTFEAVVTRNAIVLMLCISINYINGTLVHTFFRHEIFRENPRYILFIHLVLNDMIQLTITALLHLIAYVWFKINVSFCCFLQMIAVSTTQNTPLNLAGMAIERYDRRVQPAAPRPALHRQQDLHPHRHHLGPWGWPPSLPDLFVLLVTESNEFFHSVIYCNRDSLFHQAFMKKKKIISHITFLSCVSLILVFTYFKILFRRQGCERGRQEGAQHHPPSRRTAHYVHAHLRRDQSFRKYFKMYLLCNVKDSGGQTMNFSADIGMQKNMSYSTARPTLEVVVTNNAIVLMLCIAINYINGTLVHTFFRHEIFRENPRYILFIHLVLNDMIQLTIAALLHLIAYVWFKINVSFCCFLLMIAISTTLNTPLNLAGMAIERYIAVCNPLRHAQLCTVNRTYILIAIIWALGAAAILPDLFVLLVTEPNEFFHSVIFCSRDSLFHQAFMKRKRNVSHITYLSCVWLILVFTYFKILFAAKAVNADAKKARNTILLHGAQLLMCMFTYVGPPLETVFEYTFASHFPQLRFASYLIIHILPRFLSPILYGLRDQSFRKYFKMYLLCNVKDSGAQTMNFSADIGMQKNMSYSTARPTLEVVVTRNTIVLMLCISINYINGTLVHTFFRHEIFRENPRYILFIHLVLNDMIQLTIAALLHLISYVWFKINVSFCCFLLMIAISTTLNTPLNLAGMAIERYIAVCNPLRHAQLCTVNRTYILIAIIWALGAAAILPDLFVLLVTEPNEFFHSVIFCSRDSLFHQAFMKRKRNVSHITYLSCVWLILVFTYFKILFAAKAVNADAKKARNTILLHGAQLLMCMFTYVGPPLETVFEYIFPLHLQEMQFTSYLIIHILPRFLSPILYGLRDQSFRKYFKMYLLCNVKVTCHRKHVTPFKCITSPRVNPSL
ncbi:hypothetical protein SKAU_G00151040 [Synaphobranchus kaupii]|uniref:G-protein coupled receptors family 1 profile domain-containing protein n=1 Tax=Synaphobranchus kaupii TaxID=118154 RepID=A0A9Q1FGN2_SYNKA|nr:hypothetical protein SKAU_G00151040 [Synaphobranchus kaupii]